MDVQLGDRPATCTPSELTQLGALMQRRGRFRALRSSSFAEVLHRSAPMQLTARVRRWLERQGAACPAGFSRDKYNYALDYAKGRYAIGLGHYRRLFRAIGWSGRRHGLDVGSGAGHWAIAFALDNERVTGIDPSPAFLRLANGAAAAVGLADRIDHLPGRAEALEFPDASFDAAWSHGVLMFCNIEEAIREIGRVLEPGGEFYCGYSSVGFRFYRIYAAVAARRQGDLGGQLGNYMADCLLRYGMARTPWGRVHSLSPDELWTACRAFGMRLIARPGLADEAEEFAGIPCSIDFLWRKEDDGGGFRAELLGVAAGAESGRRRYRELTGIGLGRLVLETLDERAEPLSNPDIRSIYVMAGMRAGYADAMAALATDGVDPLVRGLLAFNRRLTADAVKAFEDLPARNPDRSFLLGATLLHAGETAAAVRQFETGAEAGYRPMECQVGAMLARLGTADWSEQRQRMLRVLSLLPQICGASPEEIDQLAVSLRDTGTSKFGLDKAVEFYRTANRRFR